MSQSRQESPVPETKKPNIVQSVITGSIAGAAEVSVGHPLWSIKTRLQSEQPFTLNPAVLYRGILSNAASMMPITAIQVGLNRGIQTLVFKNEALSDWQRVASAFVAGVGSALVSCPTEMVMTYQGKAKCGFSAAYQYLKQQGNAYFFIGLPATAMREGMFTAFFLAITPIIKVNILPYCSYDSAASLGAGMSAGVCATLASQGIDTIKTMQQAADIKKPVSVKDAIQKIYSTHGVHGFFKGGLARGTRVMSAVTIMGWVTEKLEAKF